MTLILTYVSRDFVVQVSDRLLTVPTDQGTEEYDRQSNKSILFFTTDAFVTMAYTGFAYLEEKHARPGRRPSSHVPTDNWFVQLLTGEDFDGPSLRPGAPALEFRSRTEEELEHWPSFEDVLELTQGALDGLRRILDPGARKAWLESYFGVAIGGWLKDCKGDIHPVLLEITKRRDKYRCQICRYDPGGESLSVMPRSNMKPDELSLLRDRLSRIEPQEHESAADVESVLVETIQAVATRSKVVGHNCMSTIIGHPETEMVRVRYVSPEVAKAEIRTENWSTEVATGYTPWLVTPYLGSPPARLGGLIEIPFGPYWIGMEGPTTSVKTPSGAVIDGFYSSQRRPPFPESKESPSSNSDDPEPCT